MLFGVRVTEGVGTTSFRKSASMNNLAQYDDQPLLDPNSDLNAGYNSDDVVHASAPNRERKRGVPWTEDEHKMFLLGLQRVGKGDWRRISKNFVKTRTPTQVASHAQKYFLRRSNHNRRRRRSSLFDITTDTFMDSVMEEDEIQKETISTYQHSVMEEDEIQKETISTYQPPRSPVLSSPVPPSSKMADLNLNNPPPQPPNVDSSSLRLSLNLSVSPPPARHSSDFQGMSGNFKNTSSSSSSGDSIISVA